LGDRDVVIVYYVYGDCAGDIIMFSPTKEGVRSDLTFGYKLHINVGRVVEVQSEDQIKVHWFWCKAEIEDWKGEWIPWNGKDKSPYTQEIPVSSCLVTTFGSVARVVMESTGNGWWKITKDCLLDVVEDVTKQAGLTDFWKSSS
jgi:hypothetical protein